MKKYLFTVLVAATFFASNAIARGCHGKKVELAENEKKIEFLVEQLDTVLLALEKWRSQSQEALQPETIIYN